jgi:glycosyltransferase involved in cell wall biosynthesis/CelD/BcsL family acetyltransferase involved in cellulose biosynthesis
MLTSRAPTAERASGHPQEPAGVAFVITRLAAGGMERAVLDLISRLDRRHFRPLVCCIKPRRSDGGDGGPAARAFPPEVERALDGVPVYEGLSASKLDVRPLLRLTRILRRHRTKVVFAVGGRDALFWGPLAGKVARVPVIVGALHSMRPGMLLWLNRLLLRRADAVVAVAEGLREYLVDKERIPAGRVVVIHNGIEPRSFSAPSNGDALRDALGLQPGAPLVGIVAGLRKVKNHDTFLQAAALVVREFPEARFLVVGDGPERERLERLRHELGLDEAVIFLGHRTDVPEIMSALEVFTLTSRSEAFPIAVLEAMAAGKPVVSTNVGAVGEAVVDGETGYLVQPGSVEALARAVCELLRNRERAKKMGSAGRSRVRSHFTLDASAATTQQLLQALLRQKGALPRAETPVRVDLVATEEGFLSLRPEWEDLLGNSDTDNVFVTWEWMWAWWQAFRDGKRLAILAARNPEGRLLGIAPLYARKAQGPCKVPMTELRFLGTGERPGPDFLNIIAVRGMEKRAADAVLGFLRAQPGWDVLTLSDVLDGSPGLAGLTDAAKAQRYRTWAKPGSVCPFGPLPANWEAYLAGLSKNARQNVRRRARRLAESHQVRFFRWEEERPLEEGIELLARLHVQSVGSHTRAHGFSDPRCLPFLKAVAALFRDAGILRLYALQVNNSVVAMHCCFLHRGALYDYRSGYDPNWASWRVGTLSTAWAIRSAIDEGASVLEMLKGDHFYKYQWVSGKKRTANLMVFNSTIKGRALHAACLCIERMRKRAPDPLRRAWRLLRRRPQGWGDENA